MPPTVLGLMGLPGAGKSQLATALAHQHHWPVLDRDTIRQALGSRPRNLAEGKQMAECEMAARLPGLLAKHPLVILDGMTLSRIDTRTAWRRRCRQAGGYWQLVFVDCPVELAMERVRTDQASASHPAADRNPDLVRRVAQTLKAPTSEEAAIQIDARASLSRQKADLIGFLRGWTAAHPIYPDALK